MNNMWLYAASYVKPRGYPPFQKEKILSSLLIPLLKLRPTQFMHIPTTIVIRPSDNICVDVPLS
jgi:hypothetical protein